MRTAVNKAIRVGKATMLAIGVGVSLALVLGAATVALAALPGDPLKLGKLNHIKNATTTLSATFEGLPIGTRPVLEVVQENGSGGPALRVENASTGLGGQAIQVKVAPNRSPISVNQDAGKSNLNVDKLDGKDQADFYRTDTPTYVSANGAATGSPPFDPFASNRAVCDDGDRLLTGGYFDLSDNGVAVESSSASSMAGMPR